MVCIIHAITKRAFSTTSVWVWSCVISFVTLSIVNTISLRFNCGLQVWQTCAICIGIDVIAGIGISIIFRAKWFKRALRMCWAITPVDETISNIIDWEHGSNASIYLNSESCFFVGHIITVGDGAGDGWICISAPIKCGLDGHEIYSHENDKDVYMTFPLTDVKYIKIVN